MSVRGGSRQILLHGLVLVLAGLVWGLFVPATPFPRLALGAHVQFVTNGMLFIVLAALLLALPHSVGHGSITVMLLSAWLTWAMALSEVANAWWGTQQTLPIMAGQAGASGGAPWQELIVTATHMVAALGLIAAWALLVVGFAKQPSGAHA
jgi:hydroxylaminobenzene mutase